MTKSYTRRCRYCFCWISMRLMPAGKWVAFEAGGVHNCKRPSPQRATKSGSQRDTLTAAVAGEFINFEIRSGDGPTAGPGSKLPAFERPMDRNN